LKKLKKSKLSGLKNASTKKKILIGGGAALVAVAAGAGGLYLAKRYKRGQQGKLLDGTGSRDISSINTGAPHPSLAPFLGLQDNKGYLTNNYPLQPLPDAVTVGLGWDSDQGNVNLDLLGSVFDYNGKSIGYVQGSSSKNIFNGFVTHTGDDVQGSSAATSSENTIATVTGDNENITIDLAPHVIPQNAATIVVGVLLVSAQSNISNCYVNVMPLLRQDHVPTNAPKVDYDSDEGEPAAAAGHGERGLGGAGSYADEDDDLFLLYKSKLEQQHPDFFNSRGFVAIKLERLPTGGWQLVPIRAVVPIDPQYGLWPALEHYGKPQPQQQYQQYGQQPAYFQPTY